MNPFVLVGALFVGLALGLLGSGGSILTVPLLVYQVGQPEKVAIASSLVIVSAIAMVGTLPRLARGEVDGRSVLLFGGPAMAGAWLGALLSRSVSGGFQMGVFAVVMLAASWTMWRQRPVVASAMPRAAWWVVADGLAVGTLTGLVGVGGGFLIVPALVMLGGMLPHRAVSTSLAIIALSAGVGAWQHHEQLGDQVDRQVIVTFIVIGAIGSLLGGHAASHLPQAMLKRSFAVFLLAMAAFILWRTLR